MAGKQKMVVITGQTATGKTSLALQLAQKFPVELISADARQVYTEMDIGTGKVGSGDTLEQQSNGVWYLNNVPIHGINLIKPNEVFSSIQFSDYAKQKISEIQKRDHIPVIVGGTAFYLTTLLTPSSQQDVPPNKELRQKWSEQEKSMSKLEFTAALQSELQHLNPERLSQMNDSDRQNPRRLMRAIEIASANPSSILHLPSSVFHSPSSIIALTAPLDVLQSKIEKRVHEMLSLGLESEVTDLLTTYSWQDPGLQTIGYYEWQPYFEKKCSKEEVIQQIILHNRQYARKQRTFLKRLSSVHWFDISDSAQYQQGLQLCEEILKTVIASNSNFPHNINKI